MYADLRLRKHADFQSVYGRSRKQHARQMAYFFALREDEGTGPRIGLTVGKVMGKSHDRNRIKRRLRAAIQANAALLNLAKRLGNIDVKSEDGTYHITALFA